MLQSSARTAREVAVQTARYQQAAKAAQATAQKASQAAGRALRAILSAARSLAAAMMAGGSTVLSMVLVICLIGLLIASPFGIFFSGEDSGTGYTMPEAVSVLNGGVRRLGSSRSRRRTPTMNWTWTTRAAPP